MVNFNNWLILRAQDVVVAAQQRKEGLIKEIDEARRKLLKEIDEAKRKLLVAEARLKNMNSMIDRLPHFKPVIKDEHQCPDCWINNEVRSDLKPIPSESSIDLFRCKTCSVELPPISRGH